MVQVGPGLDANTDTTPSAWKKKLEKIKAGYKGPQQVKSQIAAVRAQKVFFFFFFFFFFFLSKTLSFCFAG